MVILMCDLCSKDDGCVLIVNDQSDMPDQCPYDAGHNTDWKFQGDIENATPQTTT